MTIEQIKQKFTSFPNYLRNGAGKLAKEWKCSKNDIKQAREELRISNMTIESKESLEKGLKNNKIKAKYTGSESSSEGTSKKYESARALSPEEIQELVGVDGINTIVTRVWDKLLPNGVWTYTVDVKYTNGGDFYNKEELKEKLKEIFPNLKASKIPLVKKPQEKALMILISDDHAGAINANSLYGNEWNGKIYKQRLLKVVEEAQHLGETYEEVHVISLGDQLNGWNAQTTRGGHEVESVSNREQFDIYTSGRVAFFDALFSSGIGKEYKVHEVESSNHSGLGFSYMANQFLKMYISAKFPEVKHIQYLSSVENFDYGLHTIGITHGKDERLMKRPFPLKLDPKTDLFMFQYFDSKGKSPTKRRITLYKGDLHSYAIDKGKFGRYINIPSVMGSTDYSEANFGNTEPGAVLEIFEKNSTTIQHLPIWF